MVRKIVVLLASLMLLALPISAKAYNVYEGNISTTYVTFFEDIANNISIDDDYVVFRSGQYEYLMVVGDIDYKNNSFTSGSEVTVYEISTNNTNYNNYYQYEVRKENGFSLTSGSALIYSNLGGYPNFIERGDIFELSSFIILLVGLLVFFVHNIFSYTYRKRQAA